MGLFFNAVAHFSWFEHNEGLEESIAICKKTLNPMLQM